MKTKGRKLFRGMLGALAAVVLMGVAYTTTVMASSIGMIDTADLLDIHAEADAGSEVVGQVMDEGHVAILTKGDGWVQIQAGNIIGWVPADNLIEKEISNEEAVAANEEVIGRQAKELEQDNIEAETQEEQAEAQEEQTEVQTETLESVQDMTAAEDVADAEAFAREVAVSVQKADLDKAQEEAAKRAAREAEELIKAQAEAAERAQKEAAAIIKAQQEAAARAAAEAAAQAEAQLRAQQEEAARAAAAQAEAEKAAEAARRQAILSANGITEEDLYLLANIIYCEAGCEPYIGKVAVGNVVMNRVKSNRQPNTIQGVVYAKGQFSPVRNGSLERALRRSSADESCYQAALEALSGAKPVGDKLFFRRVNGRPGQVIGHHVFY